MCLVAQAVTFGIIVPPSFVVLYFVRVSWETALDLDSRPGLGDEGEAVERSLAAKLKERMKGVGWIMYRREACPRTLKSIVGVNFFRGDRRESVRDPGGSWCVGKMS